MHCSSTALVLATLAIGHAAAGAIRHAQFHQKQAEKRAAEDQNEVDVAERALADVDWTAIDWDKVVDWSTVKYTYSSNQQWGVPTSAPASVAAAPSTTLMSVVVASAPASYEAPSATEAAATPTPTHTETKSNDNSIGDIVEGILDTVGEALLSAKGCLTGSNSKSNNGAVWIGNDGPYTNEFCNESADDLILVVWSQATGGSWVNANAPLITVSLPAGKKITLSMASGFSGAWSTLSEGINMLNGQIVNSWGEITTGAYGVFDVSLEVNMNGNAMEIVGPTCTSNMDTCVFKCDSGDSCTYGYSLVNCSQSQYKGANVGTHNGADSGGCFISEDVLATTGSLKTTFS